MNESIYLLIAILNRGKGKVIPELCAETGQYYHFLCLGKGTVSSDILSLLGLGTLDKDVVVSMLPSGDVPRVIRVLTDRMTLKSPGKGIAFTVPLTGLNGLIAHVLTHGREVSMTMNNDNGQAAARYGLVLAVLEPGYTDQVMTTAREAGATGGTILHARGIGEGEPEKFMGFSMQSEKELLAILSPVEKLRAIMEAINREHGIKTEAKGVVLSLPVQEMVGLA